ncbi:type I pullulanase [Thermocaproicibacter melissae]|uniref:type I pullulanase n=1 Tax=Thermocaproicibacter melissae TaxID=2966552 RepID=UPI0024B1DAC4|nr:type I pullulanase [Thermocaproicibacter melissae]WBY63729.1 type I pullulanase [Thermocaproicibacter melissae]
MSNFYFQNDPVKLSAIYNSPDFEKNYYYSGELGAIYTPQATTFRVWAPLADDVSLCLYTQGSGGNVIQKHTLHQTGRGVWELELPGDYEGIYYTYEISNFGVSTETADPYAKAAGVNGRRSMVVDLSKTNPPGWENDMVQRPEHQTDAIVWEVHVGDFSNDPNCGVRKEWRGKYLAFTETDTTLPDGKTPTCLNYLKKLGITHVQLMPVYDYGSVDESQPGKAFNWGYDPLNYNVPEGSYSTDPFHGQTRIFEFKKMIAALHQAGIGVVMDVVYNHTFEGPGSWFHRTVPYYYHRTTPDGKFADGSACGNEIASERCMCRKYILDSVRYWAEEYHIDGFRFDLMGLIDVETMNCIRDELDKLPNGKKILMYGEPWYASAPSMRAGSLPADKAHLTLLHPRIGAFCDNTRDAIKGDVFFRHKKGFVQGNLKLENDIKASLQGWTRSDFAEPIASAPTQIVSYVSAHDNLTLWDKLIASTKRGRIYTAYDEEIVCLNKLCAVLYLMAQGMPFLQAGEEFGRTKRGMDNSFRAPAERNRLDWKRTLEFSDLLNYYRGLIEIRLAFPMLRDSTSRAAGKMKFADSVPGTVAFTLSDDKDIILVCVNVLSENAEIQLEPDLPNEWDILVDSSGAGILPSGKMRGDKISLSRKSAVILKAALQK